MSCSRTKHSESVGSETQTSNSLIPSLTFYQLNNCAPLNGIVKSKWVAVFKVYSCWRDRTLKATRLIISLPLKIFAWLLPSGAEKKLSQKIKHSELKWNPSPISMYSKFCRKWPLKNSKIDKTKISMENGSLIKVESIAKCSPWSILQYF